MSQQTIAVHQVVKSILSGEFFKKPQKVDKTLYDYSPLKAVQHLYQPTEQNGIALVNAPYEFKGTSIEFGVCYGFATFVRNMKVLARFHPDQFPLNSEGHTLHRFTDLDRWRQFYRDKINQLIVGDSIVHIPGFGNSHEFSLIPEIELMIKEATLDLWSEEAIRLSPMKSMIRSGIRQSPSQIQKVLKELEFDLKAHQMPKIFLHSLQKAKFALTSRYQHVVLVYGIKHDPNGTTRLQVWDINFYASTLQHDPKEIVISKEGVMTYQPWFQEQDPKGVRLARIEITPENDEETLKHLKALELEAIYK